MSVRTIDHNTLLKLVEAEPVYNVTVVGTGKGQRRPDRPTAMRALYDAGERDWCFREQVETAVKEADGSDAEWIDDAEWQRRIAAKRRALEAKAEVAEQ